MCSSERGFTVVEILVCMALSLVLMLGVAPLWISLQSGAVAAQESAITYGAWRVACTRLERDLRGATIEGELGLGPNPLLQASSTEIVFVVLDPADGGLEIVEWEVTEGSLMRRRGPWSAQLPPVLSHGVFIDHKTMLEGLSAASFTLISEGSRVDGVLYPEQAPVVDTVRFDARIIGASVAAKHRFAVTRTMAIGW